MVYRYLSLAESLLKEQQIPVEFICSNEEAVESHAQRRNCMLMHHHIPDLLDQSMQKGTEQNSLWRLYVVNILCRPALVSDTSITRGYTDGQSPSAKIWRGSPPDLKKKRD